MFVSSILVSFWTSHVHLMISTVIVDVACASVMISCRCRRLVCSRCSWLSPCTKHSASLTRYFNCFNYMLVQIWIGCSSKYLLDLFILNNMYSRYCLILCVEKYFNYLCNVWNTIESMLFIVSQYGLSKFTPNVVQRYQLFIDTVEPEWLTKDPTCQFLLHTNLFHSM